MDSDSRSAATPPDLTPEQVRVLTEDIPKALAAARDAELVGAVLKHTHPVAPAPHLKENALRLADHHRATCEGATCTISLVGLADLLSLAGFALTDDDIRRLI